MDKSVPQNVLATDAPCIVRGVFLRRVFLHPANHKGTTKFHEQLRLSCFDRSRNNLNSCGFLVSTENRDRNGSNSHRPTHQHTSRPVGRMAGAGCVDRGRGVQPSIAGAWCIRPSQARGASVHRGRGVHLSIAGPGSIAVTDCSCPGQCCSAHANPAPRACAACRRWRCCSTHAWLHAHTAVLGTAAIRDRNGAAQARDRQLQPAPAIDGCTPRQRWTDAPHKPLVQDLHGRNRQC